MDLQDVAHLTLYKVFERTVTRLPDKVAVIAGERRVTYRELSNLSDAVAAGLAARGIRKGDRVAIALLNTPEMIAAYLACAKLGVIIVWSNPAYRQEDMKFVLSNTQARTIIMPSKFGGFDLVGMVRGLQTELPDLKEIITEDSGSSADLSLENLIDDGRGADVAASHIDVHKDIIALQHTSGSTGVPKAAVHTNYQMVRNVVAVTNTFNATEDDVYIGHLPFFHIYGRMVTLLTSLFTGATCILQEAFAPAESMRLMAEHRVTVQHCAPTHFILEMNLPDFSSYDLSALRTGFVAGFICPVEAFKRACETMECHYLGAWGMSESTVGFVCRWDDDIEIRATTVGVPTEGFEFKIVDESGNSVPAGNDGELCVRSYSVLPEYWQNPEETARVIEPDGWLHTGDLAKSDDGEHVQIVGRLKELVNRAAMKIYPSELEILLDKHPKVKEVCIISTPNPVLGENICACIVPTEEGKPTLQEIRHYLTEKVAKYKLPDELCLFDEFPRLSGGVKLRKFGPGGIQELAVKNEQRQRMR